MTGSYVSSVCGRAGNGGREARRRPGSEGGGEKKTARSVDCHAEEHRKFRQEVPARAGNALRGAMTLR